MMKKHLALCAMAIALQPALAADLAAGKAKVEAVCAACHGANGISVSDAIPNLAGQKVAYLESQLKALKDGTRKHQVMGAIAAQLSADDIANAAAWFASLPGAAAASKSALLPHLVKTGVAFPADYKSSFTRYHTINFPATRQVRHYYANPVALQAARDGKPLPNGAYLFAEVHSAKVDADKKPIVGGDGFFQPDQLLFYTAMARDAGWGSAIPDLLRNDEWNYAVFTLARELRAGANQAECLACHKPLDKTSYTFTINELTAVAKAR
ncbi:cytochrome P460 family protein [Ideonella sp. A 288]|uniref:cytochrome P460 family protein n=1 Tax=Ideonella sp. A 288 TaxID=1962181 RepID=UPI000B4BCA99|nr:cytochrome P460 family protein [Ideonella sp. A 288]